MPEGDTIRYAADRMRPILLGRTPERILAPQVRHRMDRLPERLAGRAVRAVDCRGKHLLIRFDGDLVVHSHLRMTGAWATYQRGARWRRSPRRAWLILSTPRHEVVQFDGPVLELLTEARSRSHPVLSSLGPDVLAERFDSERFLTRLRADDPGRALGDALLDQRTIAGIGNLWKAESCWAAGLDPWRAVGQVSESEAIEVALAARARMQTSAEHGQWRLPRRVYGRAGQPCPRCGGRIRARGQGDDNRRTFWCPQCQR